MTTCPRILLVDDDAHLAQSLGEWLNEVGFDVAVAGDLQQARGQLTAHAFDVIIADLRIGNEDRFDLIR